jgi:hypothetical protein
MGQTYYLSTRSIIVYSQTREGHYPFKCELHKTPLPVITGLNVDPH